MGEYTVVGKKDVERIFSEELHWIKDINLRNKVIDVWVTVAKRGGWDTLDKVPFTLLLLNSGRLTDHTKRMTHLVKTIADKREEPLNKDYLIAGALLHDVGKLLEYTVKDGKVIISEYGKKFRHPMSGALYAKELGLPDEVVLIIYAHSYEGDKCERSAESLIVHHCDFIDFEIKKTIKNTRDG